MSAREAIEVRLSRGRAARALGGSFANDAKASLPPARARFARVAGQAYLLEQF